MLHFNIIINACVSYQNFSEEHFLKESAGQHEQKCPLFKSFQTVMVLLVTIEYLHWNHKRHRIWLISKFNLIRIFLDFGYQRMGNFAAGLYFFSNTNDMKYTQTVLCFEIFKSPPYLVFFVVWVSSLRHLVFFFYRRDDFNLIIKNILYQTLIPLIIYGLKI